MKTMIRPAWATLRMSAMARLHGGVPALLGDAALRAVHLVPLLLIWRSLAADGADLGGFTLPQLLRYTCASTLLQPLLNVRTPAASWHYDGCIIDLCRRPQTLFGQLAQQTMGGWIPDLLLFSLPMAAALPLLGVGLRPATAWFLPCLALSVSLGFAVDYLFVCFIIRMQNGNWLATVIRGAVTALLSGAVIPFALLPWGLGRALELLPFASLAGAPLAVFVGAADPAAVIPLQALWNLTLWPLAALAFRKSRERMVSYGG